MNTAFVTLMMAFYEYPLENEMLKRSMWFSDKGPILITQTQCLVWSEQDVEFVIMHGHYRKTRVRNLDICRGSLKNYTDNAFRYKFYCFVVDLFSFHQH